MLIFGNEKVNFNQRQVNSTLTNCVQNYTQIALHYVYSPKLSTFYFNFYAILYCRMMRIPLLLAEVAHKSTPFNTLEHGAYERIENKSCLIESHCITFLQAIYKITHEDYLHSIIIILLHRTSLYFITINNNYTVIIAVQSKLTTFPILVIYFERNGF